MNILIKNTRLLSMEDEEINRANIYIENDKISYIGNRDDFKSDTIIDGENFLTCLDL